MYEYEAARWTLASDQKCKSSEAKNTLTHIENINVKILVLCTERNVRIQLETTYVWGIYRVVRTSYDDGGHTDVQ